MINNLRENHPLTRTLHRYLNPMVSSVLRNKHLKLHCTLPKGHFGAPQTILMRRLPNITILLKIAPKIQVPCQCWKCCRADLLNWKLFLTAIATIDYADASILFFDLDKNELRLPHTIALHILVSCLGKNVHRTVLDEGEDTYIISYSWWKALGSPTLITSKIVLKEFDGHLLTPHGILTSFPIELGGKQKWLK